MQVGNIHHTIFKGYTTTINSIGECVYKFSYPHDEKSQNVKIEFYKPDLKKENKPVKTIELSKDNIVNFNDIPELSSEKSILYRVLVNDNFVKDSGYCVYTQDNNGIYNTINRNTTTPLVRGQAILTMVDTHKPGAVYNDFNNDKPYGITYKPDKQKYSEEVIRTYSNSGGGSLAGIESDIEKFKEMGIKTIFMTPLFGYDNKSGHHYHNKNDMQIPDNIGTIENFETVIRKLYKNGIQYVDDFAVTSEGLEGIHVQYALRWANQNPQTYRWFRMNGLENQPLTLGIVPKNKQNLRHRAVNPDVLYNPKTQSIEKNPNYNPNKETYFQIYDASQVTEEQLANTEELLGAYENTKSDNKLLINNSNDTIVNYTFEIKPKEYSNRPEEFIKMNKTSETPVELNSPEGTMFIGQFTHFKIGENAEGAVFWDDNKDIFKRNYYISGYDEKLLNSIPDITQRDYERKLICRANCEVQDMAIQAIIYKTQFVKDTQLLYTAQMIKNATTRADIEKLAETTLPKEAMLDEDTIQNILDGWYNLAPKGIDSKDDITLKALMKLPLDALEFGEKTTGVLSTSFFSNRATSEDEIGLTRYELYKRNSGIYSPYNLTYHYINNLYETKLKDFANEVIQSVNKNSAEKLLDSNGEYTEYGEYVVDLIGKDIAKYAFLKSLTSKKLRATTLDDSILNGKTTYNYQEIRKLITLKALGINATDTVDEAKSLAKLISSGMDNLTREDIEFVANSILKQIEGTTTNSFRLAEAMTNKSGLGINYRIDAAKDIADMDAVRNGDMTFDQAWDQVIDFWKKVVNAVKKINPNSYIVAEITDLDQLLRGIYGQDANVWDIDLSKVGSKYKNVPDALHALFEQTGITSEAGYSYMFTDLLHVLSADAEYGNIATNGMEQFRNRIQHLINNHSLNYIMNLLTFADNHDKPSIIHAMALDMELFHTNNLNLDYGVNINDYYCNWNEIKKRNARISVLQELTNSDRFEDLPLEAMMNIDNNEYFITANTRATAMSKLMRNAINDRIPDSFGKKALLKEALTDLTNGHYLTKSNNINIQTINIPELQSLDAALDNILSETGIHISDSQKQAIINLAKQRERVERFAVRGDFDLKSSDGNLSIYANELRERASNILGDVIDYNVYSPYTVSVAALITNAYNEVLNGMEYDNFIKGVRTFVNKFDRNTVSKASSTLPHTIDSATAQIQKAYAARDIETVIQIMIQQAEFKSGTKFSTDEYNYLMKELFESATEPAVEKALMYASFLSALPGYPTIYFRDIFGATGYEEKAKNIFLQNRNTVKYSQLEDDGPLKEYRTKIFNSFKEIMQIRNSSGMEALNNGTPYLLDTKNNETMALLYDYGDDSVITILNSHGINPRNRVEYNENISKNPENAINSINNDNKYVPVQERMELDEIILPASIALAEGTVFVNISKKDNAEYIINKIGNNLYRLVRKDYQKIILNGDTAKHGTMFLKKVSKLPFKGKNINKQYNIVSNPYNYAKNKEIGKNLSVISG